MNTTDSENDITQPVEKIDRRKIKKALWRTIALEDGTTKYDSKPNDPDNFLKNITTKKESLTTQ